MWSIKFVWCLLLVSGTFALPASPKNDTDSDAKPEPMITVDVIQMPADEKPTDNSKPSESMAVDPKPIDVKPTEQTKPNESSASAPASSASVFESIPLNVGPSRPQLLYDQRQDGKYNIRADLENFVILVVPSTGNSLLDLLKRSGQRQPQHNQHVKRVHHTKHHKKYHPSSGKPQVEVKKGANRLDYLNQGEEAAPLNGEFIEGRTPYHVDIQSDEILQPTYTGVRSLTDGGAVTIADLPLVNLEDNSASVSSAADASDATIFLSTVTGDSTTRLKDADLANAQWELTLLGAEEQCGPDRRRDSYGVCQFVPADYATT
ncbi:uncharacterized protein LOC116337140 isoform X2 [Contarinia nasturtii]|uniref:uncharacterized protein LOC116337140 isoform X2 n=1 Tax=Contarinia nasturtii TaxID=265458 RepID=UPI0012D3D297|nr:uncharacterized protein LOC116337140 isoform X2 [Contarinia nasturtii]